MAAAAAAGAAAAPPALAEGETPAQKAARQYTEGNRLDRSGELEEFARGLAHCLVGAAPGAAAAVGADAAAPAGWAKPGDLALRAAVHDRVAAGTELVAQATGLTDQVQDVLSKAREQQLDKLNASTRRLREMFRVTDEMHGRLAAFAEHVATIQARMRVVRAAKDKKYPRHLKLKKKLVNSISSLVDGTVRYAPTDIEATHSNIFLNLPDWEPILPFDPAPTSEHSSGAQ